jgi:HAD superfamily hydrolase (TIGR01549 family)
LRAVLFDLEGTLVETVYERSRVAIDQGRRDIRNEIIRLGVPEEALGGLIRSTLFRNRALDWVEENMGQAELARFLDELDSFMINIEMASAKRTLLYPDTLEALAELEGKSVEMGLVTNTSKEATDYIIENLGLAGFFKVVVTRSDVPRLKPDPVMVHTAMSRLRATGWLVGDTVYDAEAARNAGLTSIIIRRDGAPPPFSHDHFISSLTGVASIVLRD